MRKQAPKRFPKSLLVNGRRYRLAEPYQDLGNGKSVGPLYRTVPREAGVLWMPDVSFVTGIRARPVEMHRISVAAPSVKSTPKPATRSSRRRRDEN